MWVLDEYPILGIGREGDVGGTCEGETLVKIERDISESKRAAKEVSEEHRGRVVVSEFLADVEIIAEIANLGLHVVTQRASRDSLLHSRGHLPQVVHVELIQVKVERILRRRRPFSDQNRVVYVLHRLRLRRARRDHHLHRSSVDRGNLVLRSHRQCEALRVLYR